MKKVCLGVEISSSKIRYVGIEKDGHGFNILKAGTSEYTLDVSAEGALSEAVNDIILKEDVSVEKIFITVSSHDILLRQVSLPFIDSNQEIEDIVSSEIEKVPAFSDEEFDFIFQKYKSSEDRLRVIFGAIKQDVLDYILSEIPKTKIPFRHLEIAPLNLKELVSLKDSNKEEAVLVVSGRVSYFFICKNREYKLFYKTGVGIENLYPEKNTRINATVIFNLVGELQRVLKSYLTENKKSQINSLWLAWDKDVAPDFDKLIHEKMGMAVRPMSLEEFSEAEVVKILKDDVAQISDKDTLNPIYILAATPVICSFEKIKLQFPLDHFFRAFHIKKSLIKAGMIALIFMFVYGHVLGIITYGFYKKNARLARETKQIASNIERMKIETRDLFAKRDAYLVIRQGLLEQATYIQMLNRVSWAQVLSIVSEEMPESLALTSFKFGEKGDVSFKGEALEVESVAELIRNVDASSTVSGGKFDFLREKYIEEQKIFNFGILAQLKKKSDKIDENNDKKD